MPRILCAGIAVLDEVFRVDTLPPLLWREDGSVRRMPVFPINAVDTLGAGDIFHGAFTLVLAEGRTIEIALRFAAAAAGLKCARFGGSAVAPLRAEVDALVAGFSPAATALS
jgi:sulfofructose kinase